MGGETAGSGEKPGKQRKELTRFEVRGLSLAETRRRQGARREVLVEGLEINETPSDSGDDASLGPILSFQRRETAVETAAEKALLRLVVDAAASGEPHCAHEPLQAASWCVTAHIAPMVCAQRVLFLGLYRVPGASTLDPLRARPQDVALTTRTRADPCREAVVVSAAVRLVV
jgi:hypothetical protein